ncbi:MAG: ABC transporter ATP-binding protein [Chloroflexales bacterium]|nr:ABC transporter ATP-binding protein [Chloroflexales bacterium]
MRLEIAGVSWGVAETQIVREVSLSCASGSFVGLIGPNGSGKSSLLRTVYRVLQPDAGMIQLEADDVWGLSARQAARRIGVVLQEHGGEFDFSVREIVLMGRSPHKGLFDRDSAEDLAIVENALSQVGMTTFAERSFLTLSGGEKQRVLVARALAQQTCFLVLDEPTNHLDIRYQLEVLDLVRGLGVTTIAALHDLNLAALYCDQLYVLAGGQVVASGPPEAVLTPALIRSVYGVRAEVTPHPATGRLHVVYLPARADRPEGDQPGADRQGSVQRNVQTSDA